MPRFYFDLLDGEKTHVDAHGDDLHSDNEARNCARAMLADQINKSGDADADMRVTVRDASGPRFQATLSVKVDLAQ
jgi:hypothetical protein